MSAQPKLFANAGTLDEAGNVAAMASHADVGSPGAGDQENQAILDELRAQYESLREEVAATVSKRAQQAAQLAQDGAGELRSQIRSAPGTSLALALIAGGLVAVLITSRRTEPAWTERIQDSARDAANRYQTAFRNADFNDLAGQVRRAAESSYAGARDQAAGMVPTIERLAHSLSTMDSSSFSPAIEKGTSWLKAVWDKLPSVPPLAK